MLTEKHFTCDVIWENPAYGGTKRIGSDKTPLVWRLLVTYGHQQKTIFLAFCTM